MRRIVNRPLSRSLSLAVCTAAGPYLSLPTSRPLAQPRASVSAALIADHSGFHSPQLLAQQRRSSYVDTLKEDENLYISGIRHVISELPKAGLRLADFQRRLVLVLGEEKSAPTAYGFPSLIQALVAVNDIQYMVGDVVIPCDWDQVLNTVRRKMPPGGVLEPALVRYINAEGCPMFKRGTTASSSPAQAEGATKQDATLLEGKDEEDGEQGEETSTPRDLMHRSYAAQLRADNPTGSSLPGVSIHEWIQTHFSRTIQAIDVTPAATIARAAKTGAFVTPVYMYKPVEDLHPYVQLLRTAFQGLGCSFPNRMPTAVPLQNIAAIIPMLPPNPKTGAPYQWPDFLQTPEVKEHFETKVSIFVAEQKPTQTQIIFVDGTTLHPDEAEAAVHQWRYRRSQELGVPVRVKIIVVRREDDPIHTSEDILIDGYVVEPSHAIAARLALIADLKSFDAEVIESISKEHGGPKFGVATGGSSSNIGSGDAGGWSAVPSSPSAAADVRQSATANTTTLISQALHSPEDEEEVAVTAEWFQAAGASPSEDRDKAVEAATATSESTTNILSIPSSFSEPVMPSSCRPEVVVLVGSKDGKESIDAGLQDYNEKNLWIRTMLVVGEE